MHKLSINTVLTLGFATLSLVASVAYAGQVNSAQETKLTGPPTESAPTSTPKKLGLNEGCVEEVDRENKSLIHHGRIKSRVVEMGPMTMPFSVATALLLQAVKVGNSVKFNVDNVKSMATLTSLKVQQ